MKRILVFMACICLSINMFSQVDSTYKESPDFFLGLSTGINNQVGLIGPQVSYALTDQFMIEGGVGLGSWGYKSTFNLQFHQDVLDGFFCKLGYAHSTGFPDFEMEMELENGDKKDIMLDLKPADNLNLSFGNSWHMGRKSRFYFEGGYALKLTSSSDAYKLHDKEIELSSTSETVMDMMQPGGLIIAIGMSFGL